MVAHSSEMLVHMQHLASIKSNPLFKSFKNEQASTTTNTVTPQDLIAQEIEKKVEDKENTQEEDSPPKSRKGKEKVVEYGAPSTKKRNNSNKAGVLRITG